METSDAFSGLACFDCGTAVDAADATHRCPDCGGILDPTYDYGSIDLDRDKLADRPFDTQWRYRELLPFEPSAAVSVDEGATPLVECSSLADELGVGRVLIKDDGRNPTGSHADRGQSVALTAAREHGASDVALPSAGNAGQAAAAYAARAGIESHVFLPSRANFTNKAMVNVHGGDMTVVGGRVQDAVDVFRAELEEQGWYSVAPFDTPYRHEGAKTALYEIVEQLDWDVPDAVVVPTGWGIGIVGLHKAARELETLGLIDDRPALYAAQAAGCAPIADAWEAGADAHEPVERPDTICGDIEIPDPGASPLVLEALADTDGGAVATNDPDILDAAVAVAANAGVEVGATPGAAVSGAWDLAESGTFDEDATIAVLNTNAGSKDDDVLRSHLMGQGI